MSDTVLHYQIRTQLVLRTTFPTQYRQIPGTRAAQENSYRGNGLFTLHGKVTANVTGNETAIMGDNGSKSLCHY